MRFGFKTRAHAALSIAVLLTLVTSAPKSYLQSKTNAADPQKESANQANGTEESKRPSQPNKQLARLLKRFPAADKNGDGRLTWVELNQFQKSNGNRNARRVGVPTDFDVHNGWNQPDFPETAVSKRSSEEIQTVWNSVSKGQAIPSYPKPNDGGLRIAGIGHSFMAPGYKTLPAISRSAGIEQALYTHLGGGMTGSARYKWEQENGIFEFEGRPYPKILAAISKSDWEAMVFGPYFQDQPKYFECWIDFCQKHHSKMKFFISDAWPQLSQFEDNPKSEDEFTIQTLERLGRERNALSKLVIAPLRAKYPGKVFVLPTSDAMVLAAKAQRLGELPGIEGVHRVIGGRTNSIWRDQLGHLGPGLEWLEGYVFYSTIYRQPPPANYPPGARPGNVEKISTALDEKFREIAWEAVRNHPFAGIKNSR